jgi:amino acid adenylation domain-containing protein
MSQTPEQHGTSFASRLGIFREVVAIPSVPMSILPVFVALIPYASVSVVMTLQVVIGLHRGYLAAGLVCTVMTLGKMLGAPIVGRALDRYGLRAVVAVCGAVSAAFWFTAPWLPYAALIVAAGTAATLALPVSQIARQVVAALVPPGLLRTAYLMESILIELSFILGPTITVFIAARFSPRIALLVIGATIAVVAAVLYLRNPPLRSEDEKAGKAKVGAKGQLGLLNRQLVATLLIAVSALFTLGGLELALVSALRAGGEVVWTGVALAILAAASIVGGLAYGAVKRPVPPLALALLLAALVVPAALAGDRWWLLALALVPNQLVCSPTVATTTMNVIRHAPAEARGAATGLYDSATRLGAALSAPVVGFVIGVSSPAWGFAAAGLGGLLLAAPGAALTYERTRLLMIKDSINRRPPISPPGSDARSPETAEPGGQATAERVLCEVFGEILGQADVQPDEDFFDLSGDSLSGTKVVSRIRALLGVDVSLRTLFEERTPARLARSVARAGRAGAALTPGPRPERVPLSFAQQRLWFIDRLEGPSPTYNVPLVYQLDGELDQSALASALADVTGRHESLRTVFPEVDGQPGQRLVPAGEARPPLTVTWIDPAETEAQLRAAAGHAFDLEAEIPIRAWLFVTGQDRHVLLVLIHHIVIDEWSKAPFARDLAFAYEARCDGRAPAWAPLPVQYADYTLWQRKLLGEASDQDSASSGQLRYWKQALADLPDEIGLPFDRPRRPEPTYRGDLVRFSIGADVQEKLAELARRTGASMFMLFHTGLAVLLAKLSGSADISVGTQVAGRADEQLDELIGFFVNAVVLRSDLSGNPDFTQLLALVREADLDAFTHQDIPFEQLVRELNPMRVAGRNPLFQVSMTAQPVDTALALRGVAATGQTRVFGVSRFDLAFNFDERRAANGAAVGVDCVVEFSTDLFDRESIVAVGDRLTRVFAAVARDPRVRLADIDVLGADERDRILSDWNDSALDVPEVTVPALLEEQAARAPHALAVRMGASTLTYWELNARANQLARYLVGRGVGPEVRVALLIPRSIDLVVAMWAVLKAGGAFVPIDAAYPSERISFMLEDSQPALTLSGPLDVAHLPAGDLTDGERLAPLAPEHPCYVVYTSGSTGVPKAVTMPARTMVNMIAWWTAAEPPGTVPHFSAIGFDASAVQVLVATVGGTLVIPDDDARKDAERLVAWLAEYEVDDLMFVPNLVLNDICDAATAAGLTLPRLRRLSQGGEALVLSAPVRDFSSGITPHRALVNGYGPSETLLATSSTLPASVAEWPTEPSIGRPLPNTRLYVLDRWLQPVPPGVVGELYIAGAWLARGYLNRPGMTAERFVACPFGAPGERMYRSGDLVRWSVGGEVLFVGRVDHQVKVRGFRVELGEIETVLRRHPDVAQAAVTAVEDRLGTKRIVAYVVPARTVPEPGSLRDFLAETLPDYMVPSAYLVLESLPRNPNGKLDRARLPLPAADPGGRAPRNRVEQALCDIFAEVLDVPSVGTDDDFFSLGGHSLTATKLMSRLRARLGLDLPIKALFDERTPAGLARLAEIAERVSVPLRPWLRPERLPLSFAQQRLWFLDRLEGPSPTYNIPLGSRLTGDLDCVALEAALNDVIARHESLRTVFPAVQGDPVQQVLPAERAHLALVTGQVDPADVPARLREAAARPFDLATEPPIRAWVFQVGPSENVLLINIHHIAADGWSVQLLARDLGEAYLARLRGEAPRWSSLPVQYADYALWQREQLGPLTSPAARGSAHLAYWTRALAGLPEELPLPFDRPRPPTPTYKGKAVPFTVSGPAHARLAALAKATGTTTFMVFQAAAAALLSKLGGGQDIPVGVPVAGRADEALDDLIGFFVNTVVLRTDLSGNPTVAELLERVREGALIAFAHQDIPFEQVVEAVNPARSLARNPLFQVLLAFNSNLADTSVGLPGLPARAERVPLDIAKFDLSFNLREELGSGGEPLGVAGEIQYSTDLFEEETIVELGQRLHRVLAAMAAEPGARLADVDILGRPERTRLLGQWSGAARQLEAPWTSARDLFERQAARVPGATAVVCENQEVSYGDLNARANRLARYLIARGVGPEDRVAVALPRSADLVAALLAVWKAGAAYLPIPLGHPAERIEYVIADAAPAVILDRLPEVNDLSGADVTDSQRRDAVTQASPAYVLYTSGSTGRPKGVVATHGNVASLLKAIGTHLNAGPDTRLLAATTLGFDLSVVELFLPLTLGGVVVLAGDEAAREPGELLRLVAEEKVSAAQGTPTLWREILGEPGGDLSAVDVLIGGEPLPGDLAEELAARCRSAANAYGPTEATVWSTCAPLASGAQVTIGSPLPNTRAYVLDGSLLPVAPGVAGELYLAGDGVTRGYLHRPGLTAERFVACPFGLPGERMYRTGDLVRWNAEGGLVFLGRGDDQVKLRGFRVELGEIEAVLRQQPGVANAAAAVHRLGPSDDRLVGYVIAEPGADVDPGRVRERAGRVLPDYMVPMAVLTLDTFPRSPNGKLVRSALPVPEFTSGTQGGAPGTPAERALCQLFADVLSLPRVGPDDGFFDLGGHSLLVLRLLARIDSEFGVRISVTDFFLSPTARGLAGLLEQCAELR